MSNKIPTSKIPTWLSLLGVLLFAALTGCNGHSPDSSTAQANPSDPEPPAPLDIQYATYDALITTMDGPNDDHEARIDTRLYLPENVSVNNPQPAILITHGFGGSKDAVEVTSAADFFARNGYIVIGYTSQGFGGSSGCVRLDSFDYDAKNSRQLIDLMLDDPNYMVDGEALRDKVARDDLGAKVGLVGGSYGGGITLNVAITDARVRAIIPGRTWNALQYSLLPNNLVVADNASRFDHLQVTSGVFKQEWTTLLFGFGNAQPGLGNGGCPEEKANAGQVADAACPGFPQELCEVYAGLLAAGTLDDSGRALIGNSSPATRIDELTVPTLITQGQTDTLFNLNDATATYLKLKENNVPVKMIWHYPGHGGYTPQPGECELWGNAIPDVPDGCYLTQRSLDWFNRYLREDSSVDTGPEFAWYRDWIEYDDSGSAASQYGVADEFPVAGRTRFYLSSDETLVSDTANIVAGDLTMTNPANGTPASYSEQSNFTGPNAMPNSGANVPPSDQPGQFVSFTSAPFEQDVESIGIPSARLNISNLNAAQDVVFFGKVFEVNADGSEELIHRLIAPVRVPQANIGAAIDINLLGFAHRFEAGNRVKLVLATTDQTSYNAKLVDTVTVTSGGGDPAWFELPSR